MVLVGSSNVLHRLDTKLGFDGTEVLDTKNPEEVTGNLRECCCCLYLNEIFEENGRCNGVRISVVVSNQLFSLF